MALVFAQYLYDIGLDWLQDHRFGDSKMVLYRSADDMRKDHVKNPRLKQKSIIHRKNNGIMVDEITVDRTAFQDVFQVSSIATVPGSGAIPDWDATKIGDMHHITSYSLTHELDGLGEIKQFFEIAAIRLFLEKGRQELYTGEMLDCVKLSGACVEAEDLNDAEVVATARIRPLKLQISHNGHHFEFSVNSRPTGTKQTIHWTAAQDMAQAVKPYLKQAVYANQQMTDIHRQKVALGSDLDFWPTLKEFGLHPKELTQPAVYEQRIKKRQDRPRFIYRYKYNAIYL